MKLSKKIISLFASVCIIFSSIALTGAMPFTDVKENIPAMEYLADLTEKGIVKGYSDSLFAPDDICTREQFISFLWRASGSPESKSDGVFADIKGDEYFYKAVCWAYENDITKIYSDGSFGAGKATDREHMAYYLYNWAKMTEKSDTKDIILLDDYSDRASISLDSRLPFAWAMAQGLLTECEDGMLNPQNPIKRGDAIYALGKLLNSHMCKWSDYKDNKDGTHTRVCETDSSHIESEEHTWNNGELTTVAANGKTGEITYTCTKCLTQKTEKTSSADSIVTRADVEEALVYTALAYEVKGNKMQYDSTELTDLNYYYGGLDRMTAESAPEYATEHSTFYSVCSDYVHQCYLEAIGRRVMEYPSIKYSPSVYRMFRHASNQYQSQEIDDKVVEPITEEDIDSCILRWMNYDKYIKASKTYAARIAPFTASGLFEDGSFTNYTEGLTFKDDGYEGEIHYSYYDDNGNLLTPNEAREKYLYPYLENFEENLRPGDIVASQHHAMIYMGNKRILDCNGTKIDTKTGEDKIEADGSILSAMIIPEPFSWKSTSAISLIRPLEFIVKEGFDDEPGNDIVRDIVIPEKTKSRIKYPAMDIDRTANISPFGTAKKNGTLTYTIKISNKTNGKFYSEWITNKDTTKSSLMTYENIPVSEVIPAGCEYIEGSANLDGKYENGKLSWNIEKIEPGETVSISYSVKVTGEIGSKIINDGGMVDNIPSNSIGNVIGGEKLNEAEIKALSDASSVGSDGLAKFGTDTDFAEAIYKASGKELSLPSAAEIAKGLFEITDHIPGDIGIYQKILTEPIKLYTRQDEASDEYANVKSMIIDTFWGGRRFFVGESLKWNPARNCIKEFRKEYLEAGDIIVYVKAKDKENLNYDFENVCVMVYDGKNLLYSKNTSGIAEYGIIGENNVIAELTKLFTTDKDLFFGLRPSQVNK